MVADNDSGKSIESEVRTSSGMFLSKAQVVHSFSFLLMIFNSVFGDLLLLFVLMC